VRVELEGEERELTRGRVNADVSSRYSGRSTASDEGGGAIDGMYPRVYSRVTECEAKEEKRREPIDSTSSLS
jgi:hypothetical protein